ncbi:MAG TPA: adenosylcobinamide-phosphate synthase CbiB [Gemmatimonadaceae bacterium]|jgi:adenosylcobinamide-phosphate synthase
MLGRSTVAALATDFIAGEPPVAVHPTVWMGRWISRRRAERRSTGRAASLFEGACAVGGGILVTAALSAAAQRLLEHAPSSIRGLADGVALKPALSLRPLLDAASEVERALERGRLVEARRLLAWHLVSRDTTSLTRSEVAGAAIESVAENLSDSLVGPLLAFRVGGLTAAYVYRFINTADAMLGYHTDELEWFGKVAARTDDLANLAPSRITAALICGAAVAGNGSPRNAATVVLRDARLTASPNAGWPMSAMAGALGVRLTKRGHYVLNAAGAAPGFEDIARCRYITLTAAAIAAVLCDLI